LSEPDLNTPSEKLQNALDEGRTLILGAQIIVGLLYRTVFEPGYDRFPRHAQLLVIGALVLVLAAFILLMAPVSYHRIVDRGENRADLNSFVLAIMKPTLPLFAFSMGLTLYIATEKVEGITLAVIYSVTGAGLALMLWYGVGSSRKKSRRSKPMKDTAEAEH
jgi:O-antigen/teichoic acid export membrane protein